MKHFIFISALLGAFFYGQAQKKEYKSAIIAFYNLENMYDTVDNTSINDEEFLPSGDKNYNTTIYFNKISHLTSVISKIGTDFNPDGPALLGVAEIENDTVLNDIAHDKAIAKRNYKFVHYDSKDFRGVDVALFYNPAYFTVEQSDKLFVQLPKGAKDAYFTRDILWVRGRLNGDLVNVYVNHWPSRSGGEKRSEPGRIAAASVCRHHMDSLLKIDPNAKFIVMGDLNDDPVNKSLTDVLKARNRDELNQNKFFLYNPWVDFYKKGNGTIAYQDAWGLFDQIVMSQNWLNKDQDGFFFYQNHIYQREDMMENQGRFKGYPMRTWDGNAYRGGFSDHFPTYLILLKELKPVKKGF